MKRFFINSNDAFFCTIFIFLTTIINANCPRNSHTLSSGTQSTNSCVCNTDSSSNCCGICLRDNCIVSVVFFDFEDSLLNKAQSSSNSKFQDNYVSTFSSNTPSGNVSRIKSQTASNQILSKSTKSFFQQTQNQLILNNGLSFYMTDPTQGSSVSFWFLYEDQGKDHIFFESGDISISHQSNTNTVRYKTHNFFADVQADNNIWHNVFFSLDSKCFTLWFNSKNVCKCCSIPKSDRHSTSDIIKIGTPFVSGTSTQAILYIDDLNIYDEFMYYEERCDNDVICGPGEETLDGYSCTQCLPGKFKSIKENYLCKGCLAGKYSSGLGASSCQDCNIDKVSNTSSITCYNCEHGTYPSSNNAKCHPCEKNPLPGSPSARAVTCLCLANFYGPSGGQCVSCPEYTSSRSGSLSNISCECFAGWTRLNSGCNECVPGTYKPQVGNSLCLLCPAGKFSNSFAAVDLSTCRSCEVNTNSNPGSKSIRDCFAITSPVTPVAQNKIPVTPVAQNLIFETMIEFQVNLAENLITSEIKQNIRVETRNILQIDLSRISEVTAGKKAPARRLLATRTSFTITSDTSIDVSVILARMNQNTLNTILSKSSDGLLNATGLIISTSEKKTEIPVTTTGLDPILIGSIGSGVLFILLFVLCCCMDESPKRNLSEYDFYPGNRNIYSFELQK